MTRIAALLAAALALTVIPTAHADDNDTSFVNALHNQGISSAKGDQGLINMGHKICALLAQGRSMDSIVGMVQSHERNGMTDDDIRFLVRTSATSYCPEYAP
ncbi:DUF732 domain-containing protein [Mycobacterium sp. E3198]|uniref:DUF732 domain-containing protein n=1 Tax=Mycobacterium sp. E3198 TaxID=1834143 RepID=UPI0008008E73|nr:DUF732 domain-containing protein [Mycobacterium sp. E3198]OBG26351.1 hypothetical protein A5673_08050 [Mycobacterium sp. E3198]